MTLESSDLEQFTGSETFFGYKKVLYYTEGVQYLAEHGACYWLLDAIASYQSQLRKDSMLKSFQHWILKVDPDRSARLVCERDTDDVLLTQEIPFTDFQLDTVKLYLVEGILMLPSEY